MLPNSAYADDWNFQLEPYAMATTIEGNTSLSRIPNADIKVNFDTILENLESAAMLHFEAHHISGWGMAFDYAYMDLGGTTANDNGSRVTGDVRQGVLEGFAVYRSQINNGHIDVIAGARWWDNDIELIVNATPTKSNFDREMKSDWVDAVVGIRVQQKLSNNWTFQAHADVGGFGIGSSSDFTASLQAGLLYNINDLMTLDLKYKATWVDFDEGIKGQPGYFQYDTVTHGPVIGLAFKF
jgi:opacity protein-like surface antigen